MREKTIMAQRIQELRKSKNLTQAQLAEKTGLKETAIRSYENGLREPNSKAMAALERYFNVSGEYLRGEIDRETFFRNSTTIQGQLDDLTGLFQAFHQNFDCSSQERQMLALCIVSGVMQIVTERVLQGDGPANLDGDQVVQMVGTFFDLNPQGRAELVKRAGELGQLEQYKS